MFNEDLVKKFTLENAYKKSTKELLVLADNYYRGIGVVQDHEMTFKLTQIAADRKDNTAQHNLVVMYLMGIGTKKDVETAIKLLKNMKNDAKVCERLAEIYTYDKYGKKDAKLAFKYNMLSAKAGSEYGLFNVAKSYQDGDGVEQDFAQAKKYYELAAKKGLPDAYANLGCMYEFGTGVDVDVQKSTEYYKIASEKGSIIATTNLGNAYFDGRGVEQNFEKAYECFVKGVKANHSPAKYSLGYMYYLGKHVEQDFPKAIKLFKEAADVNDPQASYMLGYMYNVGDGVEQDCQKAMQYYKKSAELGFVDALSDIGSMYMQGKGVKQDCKTANQYFEEGSKLGSNLAKCNLAASYVNGTGFEKDFPKAIDILNSIDDSFNNKHYYLGFIKHACLDGQHKTRELINEVIECYNKYIELSPDTQDNKYTSIVYYKLAEAYMDLYYLDEANTENRNKDHFLKQNPNREKAKEYINLSKKTLIDIKDLALEVLKSDLRIAEDLLNDEGFDLNNYTYEQFKEKYFGKHDNLFLLTKKQEFELFDNGIKYYFTKRDETTEEITKKVELANNNFEKNKSLIRKKLEEKGVKNIDEKLEELKISKVDDILNKTEVDFSITVTNIDKYLEEILHFLFVDCMYEHKSELFKKHIENNINEIKTLLTECSEETLKELNYYLNGIDKSINLKHEVLTKKLEIFAERFNKNWNFKSIADEKMENLNNYYDLNKDSIGKKEKTLIKKFLKNAEARKEYADLSKPEKFELGSLFHMAFNDPNGSSEAMAQKVVDIEFVEFVKSVNSDMTISEASLKLRELLIKIEMFRVIIRNVASHKSILMKPAIERGINISIVQENSIMNLLDNMFGEFLKEKYVDKFVDNITL